MSKRAENAKDDLYLFRSGKLSFKPRAPAIPCPHPALIVRACLAVFVSLARTVVRCGAWKVLTMMIMMGLAIGPGASATQAPPVTAQLTLNEFTRDMTVFDSGLALGQDGASVPLSGTGTSGQVVQARGVSTDDAGASSTAWVDIATIDAGGNWSGTLIAPRNPSWYLPEVRIKAQPTVTARGANRFGAGLIISFWEQSNWDRIFNASFSNTPPDPLLDENAVQIFTRSGATPSVTYLSDATPLSAAAVAFANTFLEALPGLKLAVIAHTQSGTGWRQLVNDNDNTRLWSDDLALHKFALAEGQDVGIVTSSWIASELQTAGDYAEIVAAIVTGKRLDGSAAGTGPSATFTTKGKGLSFPLHHNFTELYDFAHTRFALIGPHGRGTTVSQTGYSDSSDDNYEALVASWIALGSNPNFSMFLPHSFGMSDIDRGYPHAGDNVYDPAGTQWTDTSHASSYTKDGLERLARLGANAILKSAGLVSWPVPAFDRSYWAPDGSYVDLWMDGHDITTERLRRGLPAIPATFAHRAEVMGMTIGGEPAQNAVIVANAGGSGFSGVRVSPNSGVFTYASSVEDGFGALPGWQQWPDDYLDDYYLNRPVADVGQSGLAALPLKTRTTFRSTLAAPAQFTVGGNGPYFLDQAGIGTIATLTLEAKMTITGGSAQRLFGLSSNALKVEYLPGSGVLRCTFSDGSGTTLLGNQTSSAIPDPSTTERTIRIAIDLSNPADGSFRAFVDGAEVLTRTGLASSGTFPSARNLSFLATNSGGSQSEGTVTHLKAWKSAMPDGSAPTGAPYKQISGTAATVNADAWKKGADAG
ncbi:MAG: hypothetical protein CL814_08500 [Confluentimicrobium sp.]|nr:hypothetical protein [Actibacterium sp.]